MFLAHYLNTKQGIGSITNDMNEERNPEHTGKELNPRKTRVAIRQSMIMIQYCSFGSIKSPSSEEMTEQKTTKYVNGAEQRG